MNLNDYIFSLWTNSSSRKELALKEHYLITLSAIHMFGLSCVDVEPSLEHPVLAVVL
jgi:hypothetical protein